MANRSAQPPSTGRDSYPCSSQRMSRRLASPQSSVSDDRPDAGDSQDRQGI